MPNAQNPFEYDQATNLSNQDIIDYYIPDHNYSRFIESTRNVFLVGERGSGKTMTLMYHSFPIQFQKSKKEKKKVALEKIGIYIACNTPLFHKEEYELIEKNQFKQAVISEHFFVLTIGFYIADTLAIIKGILSEKLSGVLKKDFEYVIGETLPEEKSFFDSIKLFIQKQNRVAQKLLNQEDNEKFFQTPLSFYSFLIPLINFCKKIPSLKKSHFLFLIDDVQDLNIFQVKSLNSWIAFRNHIDFSFKVSFAKVRENIFQTATGGTILEGHDFLMIDLEEPFQNKNSDFYKLACEIIDKRLKRIGVSAKAEEYFPTNKKFLDDLTKIKLKLQEEHTKENPRATKKQVDDYLYKYVRSEYFRTQDDKTNRPTYSGLETIVAVSTGVIRNLLYPCYWMYDKAVSNSSGKVIKSITPAIQDDIIKEKSEELWARIENDLANSIEDCSTSQAKEIHNMFRELAVLFKSRLKQQISEPRAITFTISGYSEEFQKELDPLLRIARQAQILYTRMGSAKDDGRREKYYVMNRLLFPNYGLDVIGQFSRVSIPAKDLLAAAKKSAKLKSQIEKQQPIIGGLFNE